MTLFISDDGVRKRAERLAEARHTTMDEAIRRALERGAGKGRGSR